MFGITKDTRSTAVLQFQPSPAQPFHVAHLVKVEAVVTETKRGDVPTLKFKFVSPDKKREFTHVEWGLEIYDEKEEKKTEGILSRVKHIYEAYLPVTDAGIGIAEGYITEPASQEDVDANFMKFFTALQEDFNKIEGLATKPVYILLTYGKSNDLQFPLYPNFIEPFVKGGKPELLQVNPKIHVLTPYANVAGNKATPGNNGGGGSNGAPAMDDIP